MIYLQANISPGLSWIKSAEMRVLYFSSGNTVHDHRFLSKLAESSHEIFFSTLESDHDSWHQPNLPVGIELVSLGNPATDRNITNEILEVVPFLERVLNRIRPDLVHAGPIQSCGFITALSSFHPFMCMSWGSDILVDADRNDTWNWITRFTLAHSDMLICDCNTVRERAQQLADLTDEQIVQFPWGVDLNWYSCSDGRSRVRNQLGWQDHFVIVTTRSWEPIYCTDVLLNAFRDAHAQCPNLRLLMPGYGSLHEDIKTYISCYELDGIIYCPGRVSQEDLREYFAAADCYLSCSSSDGTSVSLLEAMASCLPVIVTDIPSNREWITGGESGWLADVGDAGAFTNTLVSAVKSDAHRIREMGKRGRIQVEERADWHRNFNKLLDAYDRIGGYSAAGRL